MFTYTNPYPHHKKIDCQDEPNNLLDIMDIQPIDHMKCSLCKHFLSIKPIRINFTNGENICGRCAAPSNLVLPNLGLEVLAKQYIFPCMNMREGCITKKSFLKIGGHENVCIYRSLKCFCSWQGSPFTLRWHYETCHQDFIIRDNDIIIQEGHFLFICNNLQFLITFKQNDSGNTTLKVAGLTYIDEESKAIFTCKFINLNSEIKIECRKIAELTHTNTPLNVCLTTEIDKEYTKYILNQNECSSCSMKMTPPILKCDEGHLICIECSSMTLDYCPRCHCRTEFRCALDLEYIALSSMYSCRWKCGGTFNAHKIRDHEQCCQKHLYECWHKWNCCWRGQVNEFVSHHQKCCTNGNLKCVIIFDQTEFNFLYKKTNCLDYHIFLNNCPLDVRFDYRDKSTLITIRIYDVYALCLFEFEVDLIHSENQLYDLKKTYKLEHNRAQYYCFKILQKDYLEFEDNMIIKIRIIILNDEQRGNVTNQLYSQFKNYRKLL